MKLKTGFGHIRSATRLIKTVRGEAERQVSIAVIADTKVESEVLSKLRTGGLPEVIFGLSSLAGQVVEAKLKDADLGLVVISPGVTDQDLERMVKLAKRARHKLVVVVGNQINDWLVEKLADVFRISGEDVVFIPLADEHALKTALVPRIVNKLKDKEVALAAAVPLFKEEVAQRIISQTATQNAVIGVTIFIPGADMPILTVNQIRMVLRLSAVYNQELSVNSLLEVLAVVGGGFAFREAARQLLGVVPVGGWAVKGAIAYAGTIAMGRLAKKYFEELTGPNGAVIDFNRKGEPFESLATDRGAITEGREAEPLHKS